MLTRCSYLDCLNQYKIESTDKVKSYLVNEFCPQCHRLSRAKPVEIIDKLMSKEKFFSKADNTNDLARKNGQFYALLEDIRSLWNVGSMFRTADAADISRLYLSGITGCPPSKEISKTALGAEQTLFWRYIYSPLNIIPALKELGMLILGLERNEKSVHLVSLLKNKIIKKPVCLIVGNENAGLSPEVMAYCDYICDLPMKGSKESLNVASAFAVAAYFINEFT